MQDYVAPSISVTSSILQHAQENPSAIQTAFGTETMPTVHEILGLFLERFSFLYPHSFSCYYQLFNETELHLHQNFLHSYNQLEDAIFAYFSDKLPTAKLQSKSIFRICFHSILSESHCYEAPNTLPSVRKLKSSMNLEEVIEFVARRSSTLWPDISMSDLIVKVNEEFIKNPFQSYGATHEVSANSAPPSPQSARSKIHILEGNCVEILQPDIKVQVYGIFIQIRIKQGFQVQAMLHRLKAHPDFPKELNGKMNRNCAGVSSINGKSLKDDDLLHIQSFTSHAFVVRYPSVETSIVQNLSDTYLRLWKLNEFTRTCVCVPVE